MAGRRLLMVAGSAFRSGVAGSFLLPALLLAVAITGGLWMAATAAYYATIMLAADASAPLPGTAQMLYNA